MTSPTRNENQAKAGPALPDAPKSGELRRIASQLRRLYTGPSWIGPSLQELIQVVDAEGALQRPLPEAHSIWELVLHITTWLRTARERLVTTQVRDADEEENWPQIGRSWQDVKSRLNEEVDALEEAILHFPEERLDQDAPASEPQTFYVLLHGVIQHTAYHAGQIALLGNRGVSASK